MIFRLHISNVFAMLSKFYTYVPQFCSTHISNGFCYVFIALHIFPIVFASSTFGSSFFLIFAKILQQMRNLYFYMNLQRFFIFFWILFFQFSCFYINLQCFLLCFCSTYFPGKSYGFTFLHIFPTVLLCFSPAAYKSKFRICTSSF